MLLSGDIFQLHNSKNASACQSAKGEKCCQAGCFSAENFLGKSQSRPPCGARKNLRTIRSLDFFDRYGFSASLHPPPAALGSESPSPAKRASSSFLLAFGGASLLDNLVSTARRRGVSFAPAKETKTGSRGTDRFPLDKPLSCALLRWIRKAFFLRKKPSVLHADGLNKVSVTHLPPPNLPRFGGGERPPFLCKSIAPLTITMGQRLVDTIACKSESICLPAP